MRDRKYARIYGVSAIAMLALAGGACFGSGPDPQASASSQQHPIDLPNGSIVGVGGIALDGDTMWMVVQVSSTGPSTAGQFQLWQAPVHGGPTTPVAGVTINRGDDLIAVDATHVYWMEGTVNPGDTTCKLHAIPKSGGAPAVAATTDCSGVGPPGGLVVDGNDVWIAHAAQWTPPWNGTPNNEGGGGKAGSIWHADLTKPEGTRTTKLADANVTCVYSKNCLAYDGTAIHWWHHASGSSGETFELQRMTKADGKTTTLGSFTPGPASLQASLIAIDGNDVWFSETTANNGGSQVQAVVGHTTTAGGGLTTIGQFDQATVLDLVATNGQAFATRAIQSSDFSVALFLANGTGIVGTGVQRFDTKSRLGLTNFPLDSIEADRIILTKDVYYVAGVRHVVGFDASLFQ